MRPSVSDTAATKEISEPKPMQTETLQDQIEYLKGLVFELESELSCLDAAHDVATGITEVLPIRPHAIGERAYRELMPLSEILSEISVTFADVTCAIVEACEP